MGRQKGTILSGHFRYLLAKRKVTNSTYHSINSWAIRRRASEERFCRRGVEGKPQLSMMKDGTYTAAGSRGRMTRAKADRRVFSRGTSVNQSATRSRLIAAAVAKCCSWVLAFPT